MVNKPRSRKKPSHKRTYLAVSAVVIIFLIVAGWYEYGVLFSPKPNLVYAEFRTSKGNFEVELFNSTTLRATVKNFVNLANQGFYDNLTWHRIVPNFVIQTGDPTTVNGGGNRSTWGENSSLIPVPFQYDPSLHNNVGYLGMASTAAMVGGSSQFYINLANNTSLDGKYAVFGKVIANMSVVDDIGSVLTECVTPSGQVLHEICPTNVQGTDEPVTPVLVYSITIRTEP